MDVETHFPDGTNPDYVPVNYDGKFHGPVLLRGALANSYNIPAVKTLQFVGLPGMLDMAHRLGIESLNRPDYGLSLTLGGGDVTLLEMTGAYAVFANQGERVPILTVLKLLDGQGHIIEDVQRQMQEGHGSSVQVISPQHAYLITDILSDPKARTPAFGSNSVLNLTRPAAVKTGTTNDWRDNWTIGYTPDLVAGVWVGNNDNSPMRDVSGVTGAAPIWHDFMEEALQGVPVQTFGQPESIVAMEICSNSGTLPGAACPERRTGDIRQQPTAVRSGTRSQSARENRYVDQSTCHHRLSSRMGRGAVFLRRRSRIPVMGGISWHPPAAGAKLCSSSLSRSTRLVVARTSAALPMAPCPIRNSCPRTRNGVDSVGHLSGALFDTLAGLVDLSGRDTSNMGHAHAGTRSLFLHTGGNPAGDHHSGDRFPHTRLRVAG